MTTTLNLTHEPETIDFPAAHYVFIERVGTHSYQRSASLEDCRTLRRQTRPVQPNHRSCRILQTRLGESIVQVSSSPLHQPIFPLSLTYEKLAGGKYARFTLTGPFDRLPEANTRAFGIVAEKNIALRDDFNIEHYLTDPANTPADQNVTAILFPTA